MTQFRFFDVEKHLFCPDRRKASSYSDGSKDGRVRFDAVLTFKIKIIQTLNTFSNESNGLPD